MSRAFVKEQDNVALEAPPEFELGDAPNLVTERGAGQIAAKVAALEQEFAATTDEATRNRLSRDLRYWIAKRNSARIIVPKNAESVEFGTRVIIERDGRRQSIEIVGEDEADPREGRINWQAPLAAALLGARAGETVLLENRQPPSEIKIISIKVA
jgi:transcription elongation GreA/GreB family factor